MLAFVGVALVAGLIVGALVGRITAPTVDDRISSVQEDARQTAAALRVLALHDESGALSNQSAGDGGADLVSRAHVRTSPRNSTTHPGSQPRSARR